MLIVPVSLLGTPAACLTEKSHGPLFKITAQDANELSWSLLCHTTPVHHRPPSTWLVQGVGKIDVVWSCEVRSWRAGFKSASQAPIYGTDKGNITGTANWPASGVLIVDEFRVESDSKMNDNPALAMPNADVPTVSDADCAVDLQPRANSRAGGSTGGFLKGFGALPTQRDL